MVTGWGRKMTKIFLVEDEFVVREGIKNNIDWTGNGYEFCGEASDGERAFSLIQKIQPDIVITDIMMPFMDGLELSKLIKTKMPWIEIIILSGYAEFEYAQEAIKIGVSQYISKPINGEALLKEVNSLTIKINEKKKEREISEQYKREMQENTIVQMRKLFQNLVTGNKSVSELLEEGENLNIDLSAQYYNIILLKLHYQRQDYEIYEKTLNRIRENAEIKDIIVFDRYQEGCAFLIKDETQEALDQKQQSFVSSIKEILQHQEQISYFGGVGKTVDRMSELPYAFERASHAFAHQYLMKNSCLIESEQLEQENAKDVDSINIFNIDTKQIDRTKIMNFLKQGECSETKYFVEEFFYGIGPQAIESVLFRQYILMDIYFCVVEFMDDFEMDKSEITPPDMIKLANQGIEGVVEYLTQLMECVMTMRDQMASNRYVDVVKEVKRYIDDNYSDENLSLNELAKHVNFSPNHLSLIFSQKTGQTFIKYLTDYRINKAKELLRCTRYKSSEISNMIGYKDPHYFSFLFKKTLGVTPTQYREGKADEGENE